MAVDYEYSKTGIAVSALSGSGSIQQRLADAWSAMHTLIMHGIENPERQAAFTSINERLSAGPGSVEAHCATMSDEEAAGLASDIVDLHTGLMHDRIYALEDELRDLKRK